MAKRVPVKVFDIQHQIQSSSGSGSSMVSDMATSVDVGSSASENANNKQQNFSLVKLFMKQKSLSAEGKRIKRNSAHLGDSILQLVKTVTRNNEITLLYYNNNVLLLYSR